MKRGSNKKGKSTVKDQMTAKQGTISEKKLVKKRRPAAQKKLVAKQKPAAQKELNAQTGSILQTEGKGRRTYQDSVFRMLFSDKESVIELFNALTGTNYGPDTEVYFTTLKDVLYDGAKNDLGFVIDGRVIVLTEHQSTQSENMPLRQLLYMAHTLETLVDSRSLFRAGLVKILTPEFFVIYTGEKPWDVDELRLSASFIDPAPENSVELVVKVIKVVYNEKQEEQCEVLQRSRKLHDYVLLLRYIRQGTAAGKELKEAIDIAVKRCLQEGILVDFLKSHSAEVGAMLFDNISREEFLNIRVEEAEEAGYAKGLEEGVEQGIEQGRIEEREHGIAAFIADNQEEGKSEGQIMAKLQKIFGLDENGARVYLEKYL